MDGSESAERLGRLWDRYVRVSRNYHQVQRATDVAEVAYAVAYDRCKKAHIEEVRWAHAVARASEEFQAAGDAAFLSENGISVAGVLSERERVDRR